MGYKHHILGIPGESSNCFDERSGYLKRVKHIGHVGDRLEPGISIRFQVISDRRHNYSAILAALENTIGLAER